MDKEQLISKLREKKEVAYDAETIPVLLEITETEKTAVKYQGGEASPGGERGKSAAALSVFYKDRGASGSSEPFSQMGEYADDCEFIIRG